MRKPKKFPEYDPASGINRFGWIIKQAAALHEQQAKERLNRPKYDYLTGRPVSPSAPR